MTYIERAKNITYLNLRNNSSGSTLVQHLIKLLSNRQQPLGLNIEGNDLKDTGLLYLLQYMKKAGTNSKISSLRLGSNNLTINSISNFAESLITSKYFLPLQEVNLDKNGNIANEGAIFIFEHMKQNSSIVKLSLNTCGITEVSCPTISECLKINSSLISLSLENNSIGNKGLLSLIAGLSLNGGLQELYLRKNNFTENVVNDFERRLSGHRSLRACKIDAQRSALLPSEGILKINLKGASSRLYR